MFFFNMLSLLSVLKRNKKQGKTLRGKVDGVAKELGVIAPLLYSVPNCLPSTISYVVCFKTYNHQYGLKMQL